MLSKPSLLAGLISVTVAGGTYVYLSIKFPTETAIKESSSKQSPVDVSRQPRSLSEDAPDDAKSIPQENLPPPHGKDINRRNVEEKAAQSIRLSYEKDVEEKIIAALQAVGLTEIIVLVREGKVHLTGQLRQEKDRLRTVDLVRQMTSMDIDDGLAFRPTRPLAYTTLNRVYLYSEPREDSPRVTYINPEVGVWVTEIREKWLRIESKRGARPGYMRREEAVLGGSEQ